MALSRFFGRDSRNIWDPFALDSFPAPVLSLWDSDISAPSHQLFRDASAVANTQVDWKETSDAHIFKADLPGLKKEEIKVEVEDGRVLSISGERSKEESEKSDRWHRVERSHGSFLRKFRLPENVKVEELKAQVENGVLTITLPKVAQPKPNVKAIQIAGSADS
eukprot:c22519_g2_i1 orf=413-904(-)